MTTRRLVYVEWEDSGGGSGGWCETAEMHPPGHMVCQSVGWVLHDTPDCLYLVPHIARGDPVAKVPEQGRGELMIPKRAILRWVTLTVPTDGRRRR